MTYTTSGLTALRVARERPSVRIIGLTASQATARRLALVWGVNCLTTRDCTSFGEMVEIACEIAAKHGFGEAMDKLVITAGRTLRHPRGHECFARGPHRRLKYRPYLRGP